MNAIPQDRRRRRRWLVILAVALVTLALYLALVYPVARAVNAAKVKQRSQSQQ